MVCQLRVNFSILRLLFFSSVIEVVDNLDINSDIVAFQTRENVVFPLDPPAEITFQHFDVSYCLLCSFKKYKDCLHVNQNRIENTIWQFENFW